MAVHSDRSGRVFLAHGRGATAFDGVADRAVASAIPLPEGTELVPLPREAVALDRGGRPRALGRGRSALAVLLPAGHLRTLHPSYVEEPHPDAPLDPRAYAAVCAAEDGALHVTGLRLHADGARGAAPTAADTALRERPANRVVRQLARCARENRCVQAEDALRARRTAALPIAAQAAAPPPPSVAIRGGCDAVVREPAAFRPSAAELADVALAHLRGGGSRVSFGRACEGEPLTAVQLLEEATQRIRAELADARVHVETTGASTPSLRRLIDAGVREVTVRIASARTETYDALHAPRGYRFSDVRASLQAARESGARVTLAVLVLPGVTDRPSEIDALTALASELGEAEVELRDLPADPRRAVALVPHGEPPRGVEALVEALARER